MISIIVPVYNVENYLDRCVRSICEQSYTDLEIILVDDGSTDSSGEICDKWTEKDCRIKAVHKSNGGLSSARNEGIRLAKGKYIGFVDSDDWIEPDFCLELMKIIDTYHCDMAGCGLRRCKEAPEPIKQKNTFSCTEYSDGEAVMKGLLSVKIKSYVCNKLYSTALIRDVPFVSGKTYEDEIWSSFIIKKDITYVESDYIGYNYFRNPNSITGQAYSIKSLDDMDAKLMRYDFTVKNFPKLELPAINDIIDGCFFHYSRIKLLPSDERKNVGKRLQKIYREYSSKLTADEKKKMSPGKRLLIFAAKINLPLCTALLNIKRKGE